MQNAFRTTLLIGVLTALFMAIGLVVGGQTGMIIALGFALVTNVFAYWNADRLVLRLQNAEPVDKNRAPELVHIVEILSARAGIPTPRTYLIHTDQPNAFATGRNPENSAVAVSTGLLANLDARELTAVIAHELSHIKSRDTLVMTLTATLAGATTMLAQFGLFFGGRNNASPLGPITGLLTIIVAPLAAVLVQLAVSRTREYEADRDGAALSGDPLALATALEKISRLSKRFENPWALRTPGLSHLYIVNPLPGNRMDNLFATHPDVHNRIAALLKMAEQQRQADPGRPAVIVRPSQSRWRVPTVTEDNKTGDRFGGPWG